MAGTCRHCNCTEAKACAGGCGWANPEQTICTVCQDAADTARELVNVLGITLMKGGAMRMATARFDLLPIEQQTVLIMTCRTMVESIREGVALALTEEAIEAVRQVDAISGFLLEHCPEQVGDEDTVVDVVVRLLEPHTGRRILTPGELIDREQP